MNQYGPNALTEASSESLFSILISQLKSPIVLLLVFAAIASLVFAEYIEAIAILLVILANTFIGFIIEFQAHKSMEALKGLDIAFAKVFRDGGMKEVSSFDLVIGDVVFVESGDIVPADGRIIEATNFEINESPLTGESLPVEKKEVVLDQETPLADQINMVFKGTSVSKGHGKILLVATGNATEIGKIAEMVGAAKQESAPLNKRLEKFSKRLIWLVVLLILPFVFIGFWQDRSLHTMLQTAIALAVAAIPEGLPIVATIALARGMLRLSKQNVIIKKLAAVETLGSASIILTDKTGTLTENKLTVNQVIVPGDEDASLAKEVPTFMQPIQKVAVLCNNAVINHHDELGDPLEIALLYYAKKTLRPSEYNQLLQTKKIGEVPFDSELKMMATAHRFEAEIFTSVKGALEPILNGCAFIVIDDQIKEMTANDRTRYLQLGQQIASKGMKVLGFAYKKTAEMPFDLLDDLIFCGMIGFLDPPRKGIKKAIHTCKNAGIRVVMVTGDQFQTAETISKEVGLVGPNEKIIGIEGKDLAQMNFSRPEDADVISKSHFFSRTTPKQKLDLVSFYQKKGYVVGMTGDGINDAPALKKAEIGVAMGVRGTQVAQQASEMVLKDDSFSSLVTAIEQGRAIYNNVKYFIIYLLSCNLSEIFIVATAAFSNFTIPLLPLQILFLNLVTDVFPALALGMSKGDAYLMKRPPRGLGEPIITEKNWFAILIYALIITASIMGLFFYLFFEKQYTPEHINTMIFFALAFAQLVHPYSLISRRTSFFINSITLNVHVWLAVGFCSLLLMLVYFIPVVAEMLQLIQISTFDWLMVLTTAILPVVVIRGLKYLRLVA